MTAALCGCGIASKSYTLKSVSVILDGEKLNSSSRIPAGEISIHKGKHGSSEVTLEYAGSTYHGTVTKGSKITWDKAPDVLAGGALDHTIIVTKRNTVELHYNYVYRMAFAEVIQIYSK